MDTLIVALVIHHFWLKFSLKDQNVLYFLMLCEYLLQGKIKRSAIMQKQTVMIAFSNVQIIGTNKQKSVITLEMRRSSAG